MRGGGALAPASATKAATLEAVAIEADVIEAGAGKDALVSAYDRGRYEVPSCIDMRNSALLACGGVAIGGAGLALSGATGSGSWSRFWGCRTF